MQYTCYISKKDKLKILQFPIPLEEFPKIKNSQVIDSFTAFDGKEYSFISGSKPIEFSINTWIPKSGTSHPFQVVKNPNPLDYITILNYALDNREPIYLVICNSTGTMIIQGFFSIDFEEGKNQFGDTILSIDFKQWRDSTT